jgi:transcription elongation factor GreA-like protein
MARAKTIKKAGSTSGEKATRKKIKAKETEAREYSMTEVFAKGELVYHKVWDDTGEVLEVGTTDDGINKMKVAFEKVGLKSLRMG